MESDTENNVLSVSDDTDQAGIISDNPGTVAEYAETISESEESSVELTEEEPEEVSSAAVEEEPEEEFEAVETTVYTPSEFFQNEYFVAPCSVIIFCFGILFGYLLVRDALR